MDRETLDSLDKKTLKVIEASPEVLPSVAAAGREWEMKVSAGGRCDLDRLSGGADV
jgi:hypothetical protein